MKFSIVVPVYNRAEQVKACLLSVRDQSYPDFECIVIDDGSVDGADLRRVIEGLNDPRFIYLRQENQGGGAARNLGISYASGDYIAFLDSDDSFLTCKLERIRLAILESNGQEVVAHLSRVERGDGVTLTRPTTLPRPYESVAEMMFCRREFLQTSSLVVRTSLAKLVLFDPELKKAQDVDFLIRLERAGGNLLFIPEVLSVWNDFPVTGRIGSPRKPESVLAWYQANKQDFAPKVRFGFEATYLAYEISETRKLLALFYILRAFVSSSIGIRLAALSFLRAFLPSSTYRRVLDSLFRKGIVRLQRIKRA